MNQLEAHDSYESGVKIRIDNAHWVITNAILNWYETIALPLCFTAIDLLIYSWCSLNSSKSEKYTEF